MYLGNPGRSPFLREQISESQPAEVWSAAVGAGLNGMPIVTDELIVASTTDRHIQTVSPQDGSTFWEDRLEGPPVSPLVIAGVIYTATEDEGRLRAMELREGDKVWERELPSVRHPIAISGDTVYAATENGYLFASTGEEIPVWRTQLTRQPIAGPLVVQDWLVYVAPDSLYTLDRSTGLRRAAAHSLEILIGEAASDGERIFLASESGSLLAWGLPDLDLRWQVSGFGNFLTGPVAADSVGYAVTRTGDLVRFQLEDGSASVIGRCSGTVVASPIVVGNGVLLGTLDGQLHFLSRDGESIWTVQLDGSIEYPPFVHSGRILVPLHGRVGGPLGSEPLRGKLTELR